MLCVRSLEFQNTSEVVQDTSRLVLKPLPPSGSPGPVLPHPGPRFPHLLSEGGGLNAVPLPPQVFRVLGISRSGQVGWIVVPQGTQDRAILVGPASVNPRAKLPAEDPWVA